MNFGKLGVLLSTAAVALGLQSRPDAGYAPATAADAGRALGGSAATKTWNGVGPTLDDLTSAERTELAKAIWRYTHANKNAVVNAHMMAPDDVHHAPYGHFFLFHHQYLQGLEDYLKANGLEKYVPLPIWVPGTIPPEFLTKNLPKGAKTTVDFSAFQGPALAKFLEDVTSGPGDTTDPTKILADALVPLHNDVHNQIGGDMAKMSSPGTNIFWPWHAFIDRAIWQPWLQDKGKPVPVVTSIPDPKAPPKPMPPMLRASLAEVPAGDPAHAIPALLAADRGFSRTTGLNGALGDTVADRTDPARAAEER